MYGCGGVFFFCCCLFSGLGLALRCPQLPPSLPPSRCPPVPLMRRREHPAVPRGGRAGPGRSPCPLRAEAPLPAAGSQQRPRRFAPRPTLPLAAGGPGLAPRPPPAAAIGRRQPSPRCPASPPFPSLPGRSGTERGARAPPPRRLRAAAAEEEEERRRRRRPPLSGRAGQGRAVPEGVAPLPGAAPPP